MQNLENHLPHAEIKPSLAQEAATPEKSAPGNSALADFEFHFAHTLKWHNFYRYGGGEKRQLAHKSPNEYANFSRQGLDEFYALLKSRLGTKPHLQSLSNSEAYLQLREDLR